MRIGFLFNHDQVHQVAHVLPIALALAKRRNGAEILLCSVSDRVTDELRTLAGDSLAENLKFVQLRLGSASSRFANAVAGNFLPAAKLLIYRDNLAFFKSLDVLVVPEKTSLVLKDRYHLDDLAIIHTRHGAGDRAIGFNKTSARFDHVLAAGPKIRDRLISDAGVAPDRISIVGYPKFDLFGGALSDPAPHDSRTTVVYNPHVAPHLSSWYKAGPAILDWFQANADTYRLIFAPHIMLFERRAVVTIQPPRLALPGRIDQSTFNPEDIIIDTHSRALTTMEYLNRADIYLGDASSQVYEFLIRPRPCVFFDAHGVRWENEPNFAHWNTGPVIDNVDALADALASSRHDYDLRFKAVQQELIRYTFDLRAELSSERAVDAILEVARAKRDKAGKRASIAQPSDNEPAADRVRS